jgi:hypothetical protein
MINTQSSNKASRLKVALIYRDKLGFSVIPVNEDKKPCVAWKELQGRKASDVELSTWSRQYSSANIAAVTGRISNLVVIDADNKKASEAIRALLPKSWRGPIATSPRGAYSDDSGHPIRAKAATCRSGATLGNFYVPEWPD